MLATLTQENPEYSIFSLQTVGFLMHFGGIFPKTREIWGKMSNILDKWLHYLWLFPNIQGILINLLHLRGDFSENSGNSCQNIHINAIYIFFSLYP